MLLVQLGKSSLDLNSLDASFTQNLQDKDETNFGVRTDLSFSGWVPVALVLDLLANVEIRLHERSALEVHNAIGWFNLFRSGDSFLYTNCRQLEESSLDSNQVDAAICQKVTDEVVVRDGLGVLVVIDPRLHDGLHQGEKGEMTVLAKGVSLCASEVPDEGPIDVGIERDWGPSEIGAAAFQSASPLDVSIKHISECSLINKKVDVGVFKKQEDTQAIDLHGEVTKTNVEVEATKVAGKQLDKEPPVVYAEVSEKRVDVEATNVNVEVAEQQVDKEATKVHVEVPEPQAGIQGTELHVGGTGKKVDDESIVHVEFPRKLVDVEATESHIRVLEKKVDDEATEAYGKDSEKQVDFDGFEVPISDLRRIIPVSDLTSMSLEVEAKLSELHLDASLEPVSECLSSNKEVHVEVIKKEVDLEQTEVHTMVTGKPVVEEYAEVCNPMHRIITAITKVTSKATESEAMLSELPMGASVKQVAECSFDCKELHKEGADKQEGPDSIRLSKLKSRRITAVAVLESQVLETEVENHLSEVPPGTRQAAEFLSNLSNINHDLADEREDKDTVGCRNTGAAASDSKQNGGMGQLDDSKAVTPAVTVLPGVVSQSSADPNEAAGESEEEEPDSATDNETSESHGRVSYESDEEEVGDSSSSPGEVPFKEEDVQELVDQLYRVESEAAEAQENLEEESLLRVRDEVKAELGETLSGLELDAAVEEELSTYIEQWEETYDNLQEQCSLLQEKLEDADVSLPDLYKEIEKQAPEGSSTQSWKLRTHWVGHQPTKEAEFVVKSAEEVLKTRHPIRSQRGRLVDEGASGFLERKLAAAVGDGGAAGASVVESPNDWGWSKVYDDVLDNEEIPGPGKLMGTERWAAVYLASTPEQAAQLGLALPGVDTVEEIGDVESERHPNYKAAFANEKERGLTDRQKNSIKKVREEDDVKRIRQSRKRQRKISSHQLQGKSSLQENQTHLAGIGDTRQQEKLVPRSHLVGSIHESEKVKQTKDEVIAVASDDGVAHELGRRDVLGQTIDADADAAAGVRSDEALSEQGVEHGSLAVQLEGDCVKHDVSQPARPETLRTEGGVQHLDVKSQLVCETHVKVEENDQCDNYGSVIAASRSDLPDPLEEMAPLPQVSDLKKRRAHDDGCLQVEGHDEMISKKSKSESTGDEVGVSEGDQKEVQGFSLEQKLLVSGSLENNGKQLSSPNTTTLYRTTVVIDSDGEREVEEAVTESVTFNRSSPKSHVTQNIKHWGLQGQGSGRRSSKNKHDKVDHPSSSSTGDYLVDKVGNVGQSISKSDPSGDMKKRKCMSPSGKGVRDFPCTACGKYVRKKDVMRHPILAVGICKRCRNHYLSGPFLKDEDGSDSECSWCGEGGEVVCCGQCDKVFCQACITRNFGAAETSRIVMIDDWLCYICNPVPLSIFTRQLRQAELEAENTHGDQSMAGGLQDTLASIDQEATVKQSKKGRHRKNIRKVLDDDELEEKQKELLAREKERQERLEEWHSAARFKTTINPTKRKAISTEVCEKNMEDSDGLINVARADNEEPVWIAPSLASVLKDHQKRGVRFMWENCIVSEQRVKQGGESFGCILAHSMGLGKTLQVITFIHTVLNRDLGLRTALIVVPVNVLHNWKKEFEIWQGDVTNPVTVRMLEDSIRDNTKRAALLREWQNDGGVMLIGYTSFRNLCVGKHVRDKATRDELCSTLQNPGPDLLVCDEAHTIKNTKADITQVLKQVKTRRRIALTGSPLQNNLMEYYCMVDFVREGFLGSPQVFKNRFQNPIENGQHADSTSRDVRLMKQRSHVLHEELKGFVQRMDMSVLKDELPPKCVYVISVRLSPLQRQLYTHYLQVHGLLQDEGEAMEYKSQRKDLFHAYHALAKVWNHPELLLLAEEERARKQEDIVDELVADSDEEKLSDGDIGADGVSTGKAQIPFNVQLKKKGSNDLNELEKPLWWKDKITEDFVREEVEFSGKMVLLLRLLAISSRKGDKALVFSQSLGTLGMIERFLEKKPLEGSGTYWQRGKHWYRLDGSTPAAARMHMCERFNDPSNISVKCVLISTRAGSLGINLPAANRVIIVDGSWNPTHDLQALFRAWRLGQKKPVYAYRLLAHGTMEEKIYSRQVAKEGVAARVLDEQQVGRHFDGEDLEFLFRLEEDGDDFGSEESERSRVITALAPLDQATIGPADASVAAVSLVSTSKSKLLAFTLPVGAPPRDDLMGNLLVDYRPRWVVSYHQHEPLLAHKEEEKLSPEEQIAAWESYKSTTVTQTMVMRDTEELPAGTSSLQPSTSTATITMVAKKMVQSSVGNSSVQPSTYTSTMAMKKTVQSSAGSGLLQPHKSCSKTDHAAILLERKVQLGTKIVCATCMLDISWENLRGEPHSGLLLLPPP